MGKQFLCYYKYTVINGEKCQGMDEVGYLIKRLDKLTWGIRIYKWAERGCVSGTWRVSYIHPVNKVWSEVSDESLTCALKQVISVLED